MKAILWAHKSRNYDNSNGAREHHRYGSNTAAFLGDELSILTRIRVRHIDNLNDAEPNLLPTCRLVKMKIAHSVFLRVLHRASDGAGRRKATTALFVHRRRRPWISCWQREGLIKTRQPGGDQSKTEFDSGRTKVNPVCL
jgi:hypothetical protein